MILAASWPEAALGLLQGTSIKTPQKPAGSYGDVSRYFFAGFLAGAFLVAFGATFLAGTGFVAAPPMSILSAVTPFFFKASENQSGRLPRPDHVWAGFSGLRYFGATAAFGPLLPCPPRRG